MSEWAPRRFWTQAAAEPVAGGWQVTLDGKPIRTPGKLPLVLPTEALARAIAEEWDAQTDRIDPGAMPLTRAANSAIERVAPQFDAVADMLADYGGTDLLCYRAEHPVELVVRQAEGWNPWLDWAQSDLGADLRVTGDDGPLEGAWAAGDMRARGFRYTSIGRACQDLVVEQCQFLSDEMGELFAHFAARWRWVPLVTTPFGCHLRAAVGWCVADRRMSGGSIDPDHRPQAPRPQTPTTDAPRPPRTRTQCRRMRSGRDSWITSSRPDTPRCPVPH